jgi:hypothetical protein
LKLIIVLPKYSAVKSAWSLASTPPYVFLASYLRRLKHHVVTFTIYVILWLLSACSYTIQRNLLDKFFSNYFNFIRHLRGLNSTQVH